MNDQTRTSITSEEAAKHPLYRDLRSPGTWTYFWCYLLIGGASLIILIEVIQSGLWLKLGASCVMIWFGMFGLIVARQKERIQLKNRPQ